MSRLDATSILSRPLTTPTPSVVLIVLLARNVIAPVRFGSGVPVAAPVYLPSVTTIVLPSVVVHVRVDTLDAVAVKVPETAFALFAPSIPWATA